MYELGTFLHLHSIASWGDFMHTILSLYGKKLMFFKLDCMIHVSDLGCLGYQICKIDITIRMFSHVFMQGAGTLYIIHKTTCQLPVMFGCELYYPVMFGDCCLMATFAQVPKFCHYVVSLHGIMCMHLQRVSKCRSLHTNRKLNL